MGRPSGKLIAISMTVSSITIVSGIVYLLISIAINQTVAFAAMVTATLAAIISSPKLYGWLWDWPELAEFGAVHLDDLFSNNKSENQRYFGLPNITTEDFKSMRIMKPHYYFPFVSSMLDLDISIEEPNENSVLSTIETKKIGKFGSLLLLGRSCSGKTMLSLRIGFDANACGWDVIYSNLEVIQNVDQLSHISKWLRKKWGRTLLILDNVHLNPQGVARFVCQLKRPSFRSTDFRLLLVGREAIKNPEDYEFDIPPGHLRRIIPYDNIIHMIPDESIVLGLLNQTRISDGKSATQLLQEKGLVSEPRIVFQKYAGSDLTTLSELTRILLEGELPQNLDDLGKTAMRRRVASLNDKPNGIKILCVVSAFTSIDFQVDSEFLLSEIGPETRWSYFRQILDELINQQHIWHRLIGDVEVVGLSHSSLGRLLLQACVKDRDIEIFSHFIDSRPSNVTEFANVLAKEVLKGRGDTIGIMLLDKIQNMISEIPSFAETAFFLGSSLAMEDDYENAEKSLRIALSSKSDDARIHSSLGAVLYHQDRVDEAEKMYLKAIDLDSKYAPVWSNLGLLQSKIDETKSEDSYRKSLLLDDRQLLAWYNLGILLANQKRNDEAIDAYRKALSIASNFPDAWYNLGLILLNSEVNQAVVAFQNASKLNPESAKIWTSLSAALAASNRFIEAEKSARKAIYYDDTYCGGWHNLGLSLQAQERFDEAVVALRKAVEIDENSGNSWFILGLILHDNFNRVEETELAFQKASVLLPEQSEVWFALGDVKSERNMIDDSVKALKKGLSLEPNNIEALYKIASILLIEKKDSESEEYFRRILKLDKNHAYSWFYLGILLDDSNIHEAKDAYLTALRIDPNIDDCWYNLGVIYAHIDDYRNAEKSFRETLKLNESHAAAWHNLGVLLERTDRKEEALNAYLKAVKHDPSKCESWEALAMLYAELNNDGESERVKETANRCFEKRKTKKQ